MPCVFMHEHLMCTYVVFQASIYHTLFAHQCKLCVCACVCVCVCVLVCMRMDVPVSVHS